MIQYDVTNADIQAARQQAEEPKEQTPVKSEAQIITGNTSYETTIGKGSVQRKVETVHATDLDSGHGGVLGTARTFMGGPTSNIKDNTQVTLPNGYQTTAAAAVTLGYLVKNPDGSYSNADKKEPE